MAIQIRRGSDSAWESNKNNIIAGEPAITTDSGRFVVGTSTGLFAEFANINMSAEEYNTSNSYIVGEICNYKGKIYKCIEPTTGAWTESAWELTSLSDGILSASDYLELANLMASAYSSSATYFEGQFVTYSGNVYEAKQDISTAEAWTASHWNLIGSAS